MNFFFENASFNRNRLTLLQYAILPMVQRRLIFYLKQEETS